RDSHVICSFFVNRIKVSVDVLKLQILISCEKFLTTEFKSLLYAPQPEKRFLQNQGKKLGERRIVGNLTRNM
ncbi:MAG: hypothetical protein KAT16_11550, partial [Candidatus Heimdallarchaeota archaeon]|nr:hypothetical protein [Candidatus Heimdallarchaeota archaeon]